MTDPLSTTPAGARRSWTGALLLGSAGLNLFLLGTLVPGWLDPGRAPGPPPFHPGPAAVLTEVAKELPPSDALILRDLAARTPPLADDAGPIIEAIRGVLRAEPFDAARFRALLGELAAKRAALEGERLDAMAAAAAAMSPAGRRGMADWSMPLRVPLAGPPPGAIPLDPGRAPLALPPPGGQPPPPRP